MTATITFGKRYQQPASTFTNNENILVCCFFGKHVAIMGLVALKALTIVHVWEQLLLLVFRTGMEYNQAITSATTCQLTLPQKLNLNIPSEIYEESYFLMIQRSPRALDEILMPDLEFSYVKVITPYKHAENVFRM